MDVGRLLSFKVPATRPSSEPLRTALRSPDGRLRDGMLNGSLERTFQPDGMERVVAYKIEADSQRRAVNCKQNR
jgi:hypothetical protein